VMDADISTHAVGQGGSLDLKVLLGTREAPRQDWVARVALVDSAGHEAQREDFVPFEDWPTSGWGDSTVVRGRWTLQVDPYISGGTYTVTLSLANPATGEPMGEPAELGRLDVQAMERVFKVPIVEMESEAVFGKELRLLGYNLHQKDAQMTITLHWKALKRMDVAYKFFVHLVDPESGQLAAQADAMPYGWTYPTFWWETDEVISDEIVLPLTDVPAGVYRLYIGVYSADGGRLPVSLGGDRYELDDEITIPKKP